MTAPTPHSIADIDYTIAAQVAQAATDIVALAEERHIFLAPTPAHAASMRRIAKAWIKGVDDHIRRHTPGDALLLASHYDIIHRIAYSTPAPAEFINRYTLAAFQAHIHGDSTVDQYLLFRAISDALNIRRDPAYIGAPLQWYSLTLERWHRQLSPRGEAAAPANSGEATTDGEATDYDTARRIDLLLHEDLTAFEGTNQPAYKSHLQSRLQSRQTSNL